MEFDVRNFDINKNYAIEASAGTGKTYNIQKILTRILKLKKEEYIKDNLDSSRLEKYLNDILKKILIVTYTDKATGELKHRIREELIESFPDINFEMENAQIFTIHSFCNNVTKEFNVLINKPMELSNIDEAQSEYIVDKFIRDDTDFKNDLKKYDKGILDSVKKLLISGIDKYYLNYKNQEDLDIISLLRFNSKEDILNAYPELEDALISIEEANESLNNDKLTEFIEEVRNNIENANLEPTILFSGTKYKANNKGIKEVIDDFNIIKDIKDELKDIEVSHKIASKYLPTVYKIWQKYKEDSKAQTFNDMIRTVREEILLDDSKLLVELQNKYMIGIIDEFQDTNQKQWDIFSKIFMSKGHNIIVVGDPKQSIYSFQGADISVYKKAVKYILDNGGIKASLTHNFRSSDDIIESCNRIFKSNGFFMDNQIVFEDSNSPSEITKTENNKFGLFGGERFKSIWAFDNVDEKEFASDAVKKIIECTMVDESGNTRLRINRKIGSDFKETNVSYKDFAILYRTRSEAKEIEHYLKKYGIPYVKYKDKGLFSSVECSNWIAILEAIYSDDLTGHNIKVFKKALFTKFFDKTLYEINDDKYNVNSNEEMKLIYEWKDKAKEYLWEDLIESILIDSGMYTRMRNSTKLDTFNKFKQIGDFILSYLTNNHTLIEVIDYLKSKLKNIDDDSDEENSDIVGRGTDFDAIQMMTIHASKGLEFPVVISCAGFKQPASLGGASSCHKDNKKVLSFSKLKEKSIETYQEIMRLFYVDFTRASYLLMLPHYKEVKSDANVMLNEVVGKFINDSNNSDYFEKVIIDNRIDYQTEVTKTLKALSSGKATVSLDEKKLENQLKETKKNLTKSIMYKHSYSSLSHPDKDNVIVGDDILLDKEGEIDDSLEEFDKNSKGIELEYDSNKSLVISSNFPKGAKIGTTLHEIFEKYDYTNKDLKVLENLVISVFKNNGVRFDNTDWIKDSVNIAENVIEAKFIEIVGSNPQNKYFKLSEIDNNHKLPEAEFNYKNSDKFKNYFNGFIDLVFERNGKYSVIDWKSDSLNDDEFYSYSEYNSLKAHVDKLYSIQRVLYAHVLIDWLSSRLNKDKESVFNECFGGVYYVFIKGCYKDTSNGIYAHTWENYKQLDEAYKNILKGGKIYD